MVWILSSQWTARLIMCQRIRFDVTFTRAWEPELDLAKFGGIDRDELNKISLRGLSFSQKNIGVFAYLKRHTLYCTM